MSNYVTPEGLEKLKIQLTEIKEQLKEVAVKIKEAKDLGDLSENAEYHEAKNHQAFLYGKEQETEEKIRNAEIISKCGSDIIAVGCNVQIKDGGDVEKYEIVGSDESDPLEGRISIDSPIGSALVGHKKGDKVKISTPGGIIEYTIISIN